MEKYKHFNLKEWPFIIAPNENFCRIWADRNKLYDSIKSFLDILTIRNISTIKLMWAWVGCGKSHTLLHMKHLCKTKYPSKIKPIYITCPKAKEFSFMEIYRNIVQELDFDEIKMSYKINSKEINDQDLRIFFHVLLQGIDLHKEIALSWIKGDKVDLRTLKNIGINKRIESTEYSLKILSQILKFYVQINKDIVFLLMIDEFQRINELNQKRRDDIYIGLHTMFNEMPTHLTLILSFSVRQQETMFNMLSPELRSRADTNNIFELTIFSEEEAVLFIKDLLSFFRLKEDKRFPFFPFDEESVGYLIKQIANGNSEENELKPRTLMKIFDYILAKAIIDAGDEKIKMINKKYIESLLGETRQ